MLIAVIRCSATQCVECVGEGDSSMCHRKTCAQCSSTWGTQLSRVVAEGSWGDTEDRGVSQPARREGGMPGRGCDVHHKSQP
jgi:hypothetical protein